MDVVEYPRPIWFMVTPSTIDNTDQLREFMHSVGLRFIDPPMLDPSPFAEPKFRYQIVDIKKFQRARLVHGI